MIPHLFVKELGSWIASANLSFEQLSNTLQNPLSTLCQHFLDFQFKTINTRYIVSWIQMVVFIENAEMLDQLLEKICLRSHPAHPTYQKVLLVLKNIFNEKEFQNDPKLEAVRKRLTKARNVLLKKERYATRQLVSYLNFYQMGSRGRFGSSCWIVYFCH